MILPEMALRAISGLQRMRREYKLGITVGRKLRSNLRQKRHGADGVVFHVPFFENPNAPT